MKRLIIAVIFLMFASVSCGTLYPRQSVWYYQISFCYKGQWSVWEKQLFEIDKIYRSFSPEDGWLKFSLADMGGNVYFSFLITDYQKGKKEYYATVEYYVNDSYPTAEAIARANKFVRPNHRTDITPSVKRTTRAYVKILNDESEPDVFNLWFDDIAFALSVRDVNWK